MRLVLTRAETEGVADVAGGRIVEVGADVRHSAWCPWSSAMGADTDAVLGAVRP